MKLVDVLNKKVSVENLTKNQAEKFLDQIDRQMARESRNNVVSGAYRTMSYIRYSLQKRIKEAV